MQIALVAVVLLAGMWFTVLKPKPEDDTVASTPTPSTAPVAPGAKGLSNAVDKAKAASATSDAANAKIQSATGGAATKTGTAAKATVTKSATTKAAATTKTGTKKATVTKSTAAAKSDVDPSDRLLAFLGQGKTLVVLFEGKGVDDKAARLAVHNTAKADPKHVVSAYIPIAKVGDYDALTSDIQIFQAPSILVIGTDRKASLLSGYVDTRAVQQAVGDARREAAAAKSAKTAK